MEHFANKVNRFQLLTIFAKHFILDVWRHSEYPCLYIYKQQENHIQNIHLDIVSKFWF